MAEKKNSLIQQQKKNKNMVIFIEEINLNNLYMGIFHGER
jgi:hypothetical protein